MTATRHPENDAIIDVGNNFRIEAGPPRNSDGSLDHDAKPVFYIYKKTPVDCENEFLENNKPNPDYVSKEDRERETDDRTFYDYRWLPIATSKTEEEAIQYAEKAK